MKLNKKCSICGKNIKVLVDDKTRQIKTKGIFHTKIPTKYFDGWTYLLTTGPIDKLVMNPIFKNKFWKIIGYTQIQRSIVYFFIKQVYERKKMEYWECSRCLKRGNDI